MRTDSGDYLVANVRSLVKRQQAAMKDDLKRGRRIPARQQMQRFLRGDELSRVQSGEVTPAQFARYEREMLKRLGILGGK